MNNLQWGSVPFMKNMFDQIDRMRRKHGEALAAKGFGPVETPFQIVYSEPGLNLRRYGDDMQGNGPVMLIVPAPIKQAYIWDLAPEVSVVQQCLKQGMRVYLAQWTEVNDAGRHFGLDDFGNRLLKACLDTIAPDAKTEQVVLSGHSLGGVLAAIGACLYPERVQALLLLESPLHFGSDAGDFAPLVAATPDIKPIEQAFANVPGSFLDLISVTASPHAFHWERYVDRSLSVARPEALRTHMQVERWMCDEFAMPGKLFTEIVELLYRKDAFMQGGLHVAGRQIGPQDVKAPLLNVIDPRSTVIPPRSILPFHEAAASTAKKILHYEGDVGVGIQHVGVLVGTQAHERIWPAIFIWLRKLGVMQ